MNIKTSITDPIQVTQVSYLDYLGKIGITICPGKKGPSSFGGNWDRDLDRDLAVIQEEFDPRVIITLMTEEELNLSKVPATTLSQKIKDLNVEWIHLPINELKAPDKAFAEFWAKNSWEILDHLRHGSNVLVHCKGGLGRSGMVASLILMELGMDPEEAISQVRRQRPGAIQTREQEAYVRGYVASGFPPYLDLLIIPKCMRIVATEVDTIKRYLTGQGGGYHDGFPLSLPGSAGVDDEIQFLEQRGVTRYEMRQTMDEYVKDFEHYIGDIATQFDSLISCLDIIGRHFPHGIDQWTGEGTWDTTGSSWISAMEAPLKNRLQDWYRLDCDQREKATWVFEKISRYFQDYKTRTEERESRNARWMASCGSPPIISYLDAMAQLFRETSNRPI
jgi:predicted protein tyrosine phosphatase